MVHEPTNASVACVQDGSVFLIQRRREEPAFPGYWEFPGGCIEPGETPIEAATREFAEECGCGVAIGGVAATFGWQSNGQPKTEVVYTGHATGTIRLDRDHRAYAWVRYADLKGGRYLCSPEVRTIAADLCRGAIREAR